MSEKRELPKGWIWAKLGEICEMIRGVGFKTHQTTRIATDGYAPILRAGNIGQSLDLENDLIWVPNQLVADAKFFNVGDIAICMSSGSPKVVGKTARLDKKWRGSVGAFCGILRCKAGISDRFLAFCLQTDRYYEWRDNQARGANIQNLNFSTLGAFEFPLPPLAQQKRIAGLLARQMTAVEKARKAAEEKLAAARLLPSAFLRDAFGDSEKRELPKGLELACLGEVIVLDFGTRITRKENLGNKYPVYGGGGESFRTDTFNRENEFVISRFAMSAKCVRFVDQKFFLLDSGATFSLSAKYADKAIKKFVGFFLSSQQENMYQVARGQAQKNMDIGKFKSVLIPLPPLAEQKRIADLLDCQTAAAAKAVRAAENELREIRVLPAALLRQAFAGAL